MREEAGAELIKGTLKSRKIRFTFISSASGEIPSSDVWDVTEVLLCLTVSLCQLSRIDFQQRSADGTQPNEPATTQQIESQELLDTLTFF